MVETRQVTGILPALLDCSEYEVSFVAGCIGLRLQAFAKSIDLAHPHPDLFSICQGFLARWELGSFNQLACDLISLSKFMAQSESEWHSSIQSALNQLLWNQTELLQTIGDPANNLLNMRFVANRAYRDVLRSKKRQQTIAVDIDQATWESLPTNFQRHHRGANTLEQDILKAELRRDQFLNLGLKGMAGEVQASIDRIKAEIRVSQYCGFNRITRR